MAQHPGAPVLIAESELARRRGMAMALNEVGFEVWQAEDYDEAVALLHASARKLVVIVSYDNMSVLRFAACDRRLVHHHIYTALEAPGLTLPEELC